ncbi:gas vesicle protein [Nocardioidaceae bacterium]|nr:gas vesicle protein [Nocardioidaceae bacterium]
MTAANGMATPSDGGRQIALVDLLDRLLGAGVVLSGDLVISLAGVDLVEVRLHALITSVRSELSRGSTDGPLWQVSPDVEKPGERGERP